MRIIASYAVLVTFSGIMLGEFSGIGSSAFGQTQGRDLLGPETVVYAEISEAGTLYDRLTDGDLWALIATFPGYESAFSSDGVNEAREVLSFVASELGTTPAEGMRALTAGGIVFGIEEADPPRLVLVVTPEDSDFLERAHNKLLELARADADEKGNPDPIKEAEYRGLRGYSLSDEETHTILDGRLVISNGGDQLKAVVDRYLDGGATITTSEQFQKLKPDGNPVLWAFAQLDRLRELDPDRFSIDEPDPGARYLIGGRVEQLQQAEWVRATIDWRESSLTTSITIPNPAEGFETPNDLFFPEPGDGAPAPLGIDGLVATINLWSDQGALWEAREELLPPEALQGLAQLDTLAGQFFGGREFGDSVLEPLGTRWQLVAAFQDYDKMELVPDLKLPAFALVLQIDPDRIEFAQRLRVAFQSFLGLANLGSAQTGAPPLELGSEEFRGTTISKASFMKPVEVVAEESDDDEGRTDEVHYRHNFAPSVAFVGDRFIISSGLDLTKQLIEAFQSNPDPNPSNATLLLTVNGTGLARLIELNQERLILQNMLDEGNDRKTAEQTFEAIVAALRYFGDGELSVLDEPDESTIRLEFELND